MLGGTVLSDGVTLVFELRCVCGAAWNQDTLPEPMWPVFLSLLRR